MIKKENKKLYFNKRMRIKTEKTFIAITVFNCSPI